MRYCSIVIPHFNQPDALHSCLHALSKQSLPSSSFEILVIDQAKQDSTLNVEAFSNLEIKVFYHSANPNPYSSRNLGIKKSRGEIIGFLDASCVPDIDWLKNGTTHFKNDKVDVVAGKFQMKHNSLESQRLVHGLMYLNNQKNVNNKLGVPAGNLFVRKSLFNKIGLFPTFSKSGMDIHWTVRAREEGFRIIYDEKAIVEYPSKTFPELLRSIKKYASGAALITLNTKTSPYRFLRTFMPLRIHHFLNALRYRNLDDLTVMKRINLYFLIWRARIEFGKQLFKARSSRKTET